MADGTETRVENNTPTAEEYAALKAGLEAEKAKATELVAEATKPLQDRVAELESELETKAGVITGLEDQLAKANAAHSDLVEEFEGAKAAYAYAVEDFKKLAIASNPLIPQEAIYGGSIEEIKASLDRANKLVANVQSFLQEGLSKQAQADQVPAGAPQRTGPDVSAMSTKEKINLGLEQARKKKEA